MTPDYYGTPGSSDVQWNLPKVSGPLNVHCQLGSSIPFLCLTLVRGRTTVRDDLVIFFLYSFRPLFALPPSGTLLNDFSENSFLEVFRPPILSYLNERIYSPPSPPTQSRRVTSCVLLFVTTTTKELFFGGGGGFSMGTTNL